MKRIFIVVILFALQIFLLFEGASSFGRDINPFLLFPVCLSIPILFLADRLKPQMMLPAKGTNKSRVWVWVIFLMLLTFITYIYNIGFHFYSTPGTGSDVIPQLEALAIRFSKGEQPYYPLQLVNYAPFPVYMPAHWLPLVLPLKMGFDTRWLGLAMLFAVMISFFAFYVKQNTRPINAIIISLFFAAILAAYYYWGGTEQFVTIETIVTSYYIILAIGLYTRKLGIIIAGIALCLLSRYTIIFWTPLFAVLLLSQKPLKQSFMVWGIVIAAIVVIYIIPFLVPAPNILLDGVHYHNQCAVYEWAGSSGTFERGDYFAAFMKANFTGEMEQRVFKARVVQGSVMILLCIIGWLCYRRWKDRIHIYDLSLAFLSMFLTCFYMIGPLTYLYYFTTPLFISAILCGMYISGRRADTITKTAISVNDL